MNRDLKICNCKKSNCLKLYCDCFANGSYCNFGKCNCFACMNNLQSEDRRNRAIMSTLERDPFAFRPKVATKEVDRSHKKGCNCKKSNCLKKYCECFQGGIACSDKCKCVDCLNLPGSGPGRTNPPSSGPSFQHLNSHSKTSVLVEAAESQSSVAEETDRSTPTNQLNFIGLNSQLTFECINSQEKLLSLATIATPHFDDNDANRDEGNNESTHTSGLPMNVIKRICETMIENLIKRVKPSERESEGGFQFIDDDEKSVISMESAVLHSFCGAINKEIQATQRQRNPENT